MRIQHFVPSIFLLFLSLVCLGGSRGVGRLEWTFPINRTHAGILLGNGIQGVMVWGDSNQLNLTVSRAGFWDHRGNLEVSGTINYEFVKRCLYKNDFKTLKAAFDNAKSKTGVGDLRPYQLGGGRIEVVFPLGYRLKKGELDLSNGQISIFLTDSAGDIHTAVIRQDIPNELIYTRFSSGITGKINVRCIPSYAHPQVKEKLDSYGVKPPENWQKKWGTYLVSGFTQRLPADLPLSLAYLPVDNRQLLVSTALGNKSRDSAYQLIAKFDSASFISRINEWWKNYWDETTVLRLPDAALQEIWDYGLYKQACSNPPHAPACSLQGPFMEEYRLPAWSNDYHFNINIQMIYGPALATNRIEHYAPLWNMINQNMPKLKKYGQSFFACDSAILIPHAVNDRMDVQGGFWTGNIDHGSTAWVAEMAWLYYRYTLDTAFLRKTAYVLLKGAFEGFWTMKEVLPDGRFRLPVTVSPEYKGARSDAWGSNASFQLAAFHSTAQLLQKAASVLDQPQDKRWQEVREHLPEYSLIKASRVLEYPEYKQFRIALWDSMDLVESHRHHSHLAGIFPFRTYDPNDSIHQPIVRASLFNWLRKGSGSWTGWCVPWASVILSRSNQPDAALSWLHWWKGNFTNEGRGTLCDAAFWGVSTAGNTQWGKSTDINQCKEIMQLDAGFGALTAIQELLVQQRGEETQVVVNLPLTWKELEFERLRTEGAFLLSAKVEDGRLTKLVIKSTKNAQANFVFPGFLKDGDGTIYRNRFEKNMIRGEEVTLVPEENLK